MEHIAFAAFLAISVGFALGGVRLLLSALFFFLTPDTALADSTIASPPMEPTYEGHVQLSTPTA